MTLTPIIANIDEAGYLSVQDYTDGTISFTGFLEKEAPAISKACSRILNTVGYDAVSGTYLARPYPMLIQAGGVTVFIVPTLYFGCRNTLLSDYSDIEVVRGISFTGQFI